MMTDRPLFTELEQPFTCAAIYEPTVDAATSIMKESEFAGADSFILNLMGDGTQGLREEFLTEDHLERLFQSTSKPTMACYYRWHFGGESVDVTDEERQEILRRAVRAGAKCVDLVGDTFDPTLGPDVFTEEAKRYSLESERPPREVTDDPDAVARQEAEIERIHELGAEVQMSAHTRIHLDPEQALAVAETFQDRGADIVKLVSVDRSWEDMLETLEATVLLDRELDVPFIMMSHGEHGVLARYIAPFLGSMLCFTQQEYVPGGFYSQPLTENVNRVFDAVQNVTPTRDPEEVDWL
ncbi:type I 3-dehydroquinate dehydratase [Halobellus limi]|uniref:3-dehydroquinate dehydratase n=2 Tax=Halobellus limi TaxID=699433 RepID=A0A1H6BQU1_9EURY|nr:type I 3-dehydroquinate dehydratase [Halobellus limi]SEG62797.1 3-dehydroquinate dehydratase [Halobellus limi]